jgi:3-oxoacyl-[acyl-carrier protein] reductase
MELKLHGARRLTIRAWDALKLAKGSVVFMSGSAALDPKPAFAAVAATNAAITALAKAFAEQGIKDGVQVNSIVPGAVMTGRRRSFLEKWAPAHNMSVEDAMKKFPEEAGINRCGRPAEIAELLGFMVSPAAKWMTGTSLRMDGGEVFRARSIIRQIISETKLPIPRNTEHSFAFHILALLRRTALSTSDIANGPAHLRPVARSPI